ncbi:hypothetical protein [Amycolatopsis sp. NPDC051716]|jgi:hypothetical protein|uniref:hypothetical protein n=1 Tax=Amycolatopsis sp. NPDC051716 TaxID=3155804 RepID=UPI0034191B59
MTDLERKLAEALRGQAGEVAPNLDAAWAEQQRRQRRPSRRRRAAVWGAPLAAVLAVLTSVVLATNLNTAQSPGPEPAARQGQELVLARPLLSLRLNSAGELKALTDFVGQTNTWTSYASQALDDTGRPVFCIEALPKGATHGGPESYFGVESPSCVPVSGSPVNAGYIGKNGGPLPAGKAVFLVDRAVHVLRLYDAAGDLSQGKLITSMDSGQVFLADVNPDSPPVRFEVS